MANKTVLGDFLKHNAVSCSVFRIADHSHTHGPSMAIQQVYCTWLQGYCNVITGVHVDSIATNNKVEYTVITVSLVPLAFKVRRIVWLCSAPDVYICSNS